MHVTRLGDALPKNAAKPFDVCTLRLKMSDADHGIRPGPSPAGRRRRAARHDDATYNRMRDPVSAGPHL
jgi:hypothetical protein